ncbi:hypothetical protein DL95DRAFT_411819 [Leptodontidium sp. 2 PMI_412]|nr:hypothetical protein BKA61DRAFT_580401 [Leptodontidium sp. MPI-SDFR-AT-0119]KAH9211784.1 hypothetical protein DL95DRAFT_411819 [Leptodontidium sp. 2 PMI_412]
MSAFAFFLFLYTLGIFYIIIAGLATPSSLTDDDVSKYGIDKVSGFCGPGSWAAWLFTAAACCLSRLLRDSNSYNDTYTSTAALDLDLVATFAYPCIAAGDAILRLQNAASDTLSSSNLGCIATPLIVVKTGAGVCVLLAMICTRNWKQKSGRGISASFASVSALFLVYSAVAFDIIIAGIPPRNILAGVLFLLSPVYPPTTPQSTSLSKLLFASGLLSPAITGLSDIPFSQPKDLSKPISLYFAYTFIGLTLVFNSNLGQPKMSLATPFIFFLPIVCFHIALWTSIILVQFALFYFVYQH